MRTLDEVDRELCAAWREYAALEALFEAAVDPKWGGSGPPGPDNEIMVLWRDDWRTEQDLKDLQKHINALSAEKDLLGTLKALENCTLAPEGPAVSRAS